jgi:hypothetical protein
MRISHQEDIMTNEQILLEKWRTLPDDKQQQVLELVESFCLEEQTITDPVASYQPKTELGKRLQKIRTAIVASGESLLDLEGIEREKAERRGGYQGDNG